MRVREARLSDAGAIARVQVHSWQLAYIGLVPQPVLDAMSIAQRTTRWERILSGVDAVPASQVLVVGLERSIIAWASFGPARDGSPPATGEIFGFYAHPNVWSRGVGHQLMVACESELRVAGHERAYLWVLEGNHRAQRFYERHGWHADGGTKVDKAPEMTLSELRHVKNLVEPTLTTKQ